MSGKDRQKSGRVDGGDERAGRIENNPDERRIRQAEDEAEKVLGTGSDEDVRSATPSDGTGVSGTVPRRPAGG